jgi:hypothetical protein
MQVGFHPWLPKAIAGKASRGNRFQARRRLRIEPSSGFFWGDVTDITSKTRDACYLVTATFAHPEIRAGYIYWQTNT